MDVQFYGANCIVFSNKELRLVVDDNLAQLGAKSVTKPDDVVLFTGPHDEKPVARMLIDIPGEYEIGNVSIQGIPARAHMDEAGTLHGTMYKLTVGELVYLVTGHIYPELSDEQLEAIGMVDVMFTPVGGNGFTLDPVGAQKVIRAVEPKVVVPTHYEDTKLQFEVPQQPLENAIKEMSLEPKERVEKLRLKAADLSDITQLIVLEKVA